MKGCFVKASRNEGSRVDTILARFFSAKLIQSLRSCWSFRFRMTNQSVALIARKTCNTLHINRLDTTHIITSEPLCWRWCHRFVRFVCSCFIWSTHDVCVSPVFVRIDFSWKTTFLRRHSFSPHLFCYRYEMFVGSSWSEGVGDDVFVHELKCKV